MRVLSSLALEIRYRSSYALRSAFHCTTIVLLLAHVKKRAVSTYGRRKAAWLNLNRVAYRLAVASNGAGLVLIRERVTLKGA